MKKNDLPQNNRENAEARRVGQNKQRMSCQARRRT
jgi:hypothetical protein